MTRRRAWRAAAIAVGVVGVLGLTFKVFQRPIGMRVAGMVISSRMGKQAMAGLPDGLHVGLCGSGSPMPDADRAGPCVFVIAGKHLYVVDAGEGSPRKLALMGLGPQLIDGIFLTHYHSDHIGGLGEMMLQRWAGSGSATPVEVFGPQGAEAVVEGFNHAYALDTGYRVAHHGAATMPPTGAGGAARPFNVPEGRDFRQVVLERDGLTVTAFNVIHTPVFPAVGYRFDYGGRSVVVSGDTAPSEWLAENARGVDVLFHEALQTALVEAARLAEEAGARHLVLYHAIPPLPSRLLYPAFLGDAAERYHGPITIGRDGLVVSLPSGGHEITVGDLL
jgi:ribonuclease Z